MKPLLVFGTRPEAIKLAPVFFTFQKKGIQPLVCVTSQHQELLRQMLDLFAIRPDYDFELMEENQDLLGLASRALSRFQSLFDDVRPDCVVVQGDTTTAFIASLAAAYRKIPVAHVEAGLRSFNHHNPFPEEINRTLVDQVARWCFAPTERSKENLLREGIAPEKIHVTGNTVVDALEMIRGKIGPAPGRGKSLILVTTHRRESFGKDLQSICRALLVLAERLPETRFVLPVHPNPNVREPVYRLLSSCEQIDLTAPMDYESFLRLLMRADLVLTDSGGVQEEAPSFGVPVVVMRKTTERPELVESGFGELVGTETDAIVAAAHRLLKNRPRLAGLPNPFGDGQAAPRIVEILLANR
ncbi:MAG: UDP-N-acetylglucosamine 2-epimerase (non-hydrolyzing) [Deltaproteobacteria bacterium]|nr:UDP-N-acetylglucosamine 2-epimerase (non-hydrolyzing) [Deltaproteobacteria bacterium]MBI4224101.1 UDP-N-acetylglucosamine 2-epimerase (non-hydrolyzing) [Deltaproteobacteria bacterium]